MKAPLCLPAALFLCAVPLARPALAADWPQWRGPARDGHVSAGAPVPTTLPAEPKTLWRIKVGGGFSSPVIGQGKLVYLDESDGRDVIRALDPLTGREAWNTPFAESFKDEFGTGPRSTPIIDGDRAFALSIRGEFGCFNLADGKILWRSSFGKDFGAAFLGNIASETAAARRRGNNGSPVIDGGRVIVPVGGTNGASIVAFDKKTGQVIWKSQDDEVAYSSPVIATLAGRKQVVAMTTIALIGLDPDDGKLLWRVPFHTAAHRHAASPVVVGDQVVINSHTFGLVSTKISRDSGGFLAREAWANKALKINVSTPVLVGRHLYSQGPARNFVCVDAQTGEQLWSAPGFGDNRDQNTSVIVLGQNLLTLTDQGQMRMIAADPEKYTELARLQACGANWHYPAYVEGKLYVRDKRELVCLDLLGAK